MKLAYVVAQPWSREVLLADGSWGDSETYEPQIELFSCLVAAQRRAARYLNLGLEAAVCPWELPEPERGQ
jgi:hypothetical protein